MTGLSGTSRIVSSESEPVRLTPILNPVSPFMLLWFRKSEKFSLARNPVAFTCAKSSIVPGRLLTLILYTRNLPCCSALNAIESSCVFPVLNPSTAAFMVMMVSVLMLNLSELNDILTGSRKSDITLLAPEVRSRANGGSACCNAIMSTRLSAICFSSNVIVPVTRVMNVSIGHLAISPATSDSL